MVEFATHFHSKIYSNELTGLPLPSPDVAQNIALLGHSVGAGLSSYVASEKAREGQAFEGVMYMAPQTEVSILMHCANDLLLGPGLTYARLAIARAKDSL